MVTTSKLALAALAISGCSSSELMPGRLTARTGPAEVRSIRKVVATPATCGTFDLTLVDATAAEKAFYGTDKMLRHVGTCPAYATVGVDQALRAALEFGGFAVVDSEKVNAITGTRQEILRRHAHSEQRNDQLVTESAGERRSTEVVGARFSDATPLEQEAIVAELGASGIVQTRIAIGAGVGAGSRRTATIQVRLLEMPSRQLAWVRRCELEIGGMMGSDEVAMERGIRCAVDGVVAR